MTEGDESISSTASASLAFVNRAEEMGRIRDTLKRASAGEGELLIIRGEAGSGKTRLLQEAAAEAEKQGFSVGFGTALAESVVPYNPWKAVLEYLGLDPILEERPPPKLLGLCLMTTDGSIRVKVEREGLDSDILSEMTSIFEELVHNPKVEHEVLNGGLIRVGRHERKSILWRGSDIHLGAVVEGDEDEAFLEDMMAMAEEAESNFGGEDLQHEGEGPHQAIEAQMRQLLNSEIYEGIDYAKEDPKLRQNRLFELIVLGLSRKAGDHPVCVAIDDLQWADPSSLALLHYVARNTRKTSVLLLGTYRVEEAAARPQLKHILKAMEMEEILAEMDLNGLTREDLPDLAESFIGPHILSDAFLNLLWRETRGFPLFVREVLLGLEDDGEIGMRGAVKRLVRSPDELALPERVRDVIRARLNRLPSEDRRILDAAATCGTRFTAALVSRVAGEEETKVLNGLSAIAKVHGLLRPTDSGFTFDHPAVQEVLYDGVPTETRRAYHGEAAEWLELAGGPVEEIGEHYYRARDPRAVALLCDAAQIARAKYANKESIRFYTEALELEENAQKRMGILDGLGEVCDLIGDFEKGIESLEGALALAQEKVKRAEILARIGWIQSKRGEREECMRFYTKALSLVDREGCKEEALVLFYMGQAHFDGGEYDEAVEYYRRSMEIAEKVGDHERVASCLTCTGIVHKERGNYDQALAFYEKSLAIKERMEHQTSPGILNNIGTVHKELGNYDQALEYLNKAVDISERIGHSWYLAIHLGNIGCIHLARGENERALKRFEKSLEIRESIGERGGMSGEMFNIGLVHKNRGDYDRALDYMRKGRELIEEVGNRWWLSEAYNFTAEVHFEKRDLKKALDYCNLALSLANEMNRKQDVGNAKLILGMVYRERKMWEESTENFEQSIEIFKGLGMKYELGRSHYEFGLMWREEGDVSEALQHLGRAVQSFEKMNLEKDLLRAEDAYESIQSEQLKS